MAITKLPSAQTQRELREITRPLQSINLKYAAINMDIQRLRDDTIKMADDRLAGRYRGAMSRLARKNRLQKKSKNKGHLTEMEWLGKTGELSKSFDYSYPVGQLRAAHMIEYAMQPGFQMFGEPADLVWFVQGWQDRINERLQHTPQRVIMTLGVAESKKNGVTPTIYFEVVTIERYDELTRVEDSEG